MHCSALLAVLLVPAPQEPPTSRAPRPTVHSVCDLSQEFTFYMDGRFHRQYLAGVGRDARNWGSLARLDLSNANLLVLTGGDARIPYGAEAMTHIGRFVAAGGTVLLMADGGATMPPGAALAEHLGGKLTAQRATPPLLRVAEPGQTGAQVEFRGGTVLDLDPRWQVLVRDHEQRPVLAQRREQRGTILLGSRGLFGARPDASDPINAAWITPLLVQLASQRPVDPGAPHRDTFVEHTREVGPLTLEFHDGTAPFADQVAAEYLAVRPHLVAITGVEPAPGMITRMLILPTGGGGFSSGERIAIGAWWGDYPHHRYPMVELIAHEAGHSWVLPAPEPLWNEPIATYLGIQVGRRLGMAEADRTLAQQIAAGRRHDPDFTRVNPLASDAPRDLVWGKSFFVFEELERRHGPGALAQYFRCKRTALQPGRAGYSMDDCVAVWSRAVGTDLFPWFRGLAFDVDPTRVRDLAPDTRPAR